MEKKTNDQVDETDLIAIRKHLHAHPELSGKEYQTAKKIVSFLRQYQPTRIIEHIGETGVLAEFDFGNDGPTVLFRADTDALPIQEINEFEHRSIYEKVSHKCGHDGHTTILIGLAKQLSEKPFSRGKVILLFQPAEEIGAGAKAILSDPEFKGIQPDYVFALHNLPAYPLHQIVVRKDSFTASVISLTIKLFGKTAHAAEPEHGINPAIALADILKHANQLSNNHPEQTDFSVITPVHMELGSIDFGISAGYGELRFTLRTWTEDRLQSLCKGFEQTIHTLAKEHGLQTVIERSQHFSANQNDSEAVDLIFKAAKNNNLSLLHRPFPFKWGEDFGLFTQHFKGAMFGLGAGENSPALHNPDYDFPDQILDSGINMFYQIASEILQQEC
ncbi:MAG: amidohydrolase [Bacteroidetes bacterium]|nr:MAG: amidohydrolase [Bacteroidota bacterium]